jgi:hypothetical protein
MDPQDEINATLEKVVLRAFELVRKHGFHIPMGIAMSASQQWFWVVADSSERPDDAELDLTACAESIRLQLRRMAKTQPLCTAAIATNLISKFHGQETEKTTIKVSLDHATEKGLTIYYPYSLADGKITQETPIESQAEESFFDCKDQESK